MRTTPTLAGQTILAIGGSSGIGFGVALAALNNGAAKVIIGSSSSEKVKNATQRLRSKTGAKESQIDGVVIDVKDLTAVEKTIRGLGVINHLAFTSGDALAGFIGKNVVDVDLVDAKDKILEVRFWGAIQAARSAIFPPEGGSITFTSGVNSYKPAPGWQLACAIGNSVQGLTAGLAVDLAPKGVRVNCVSPGWIETEVFDQFPPETKKDMLEKAVKGILARRWGAPEDTAEAYIFLMKCGFITGETIKVDGGQLLTPFPV